MNPEPNASERRLSRMRHDLANPLSAVLAEAQLLLLAAEELPPDAVTALRAIETAAIRMRTILQESQRAPAAPGQEPT